MLKVKYCCGCLATVLIFSISLGAEARLASNGVSLKGNDLNASQITPAATADSIRLEGGQLVIQTTPIAQ
ncbi:MAG: hypothetical protein ACRDEA_06300 [Microcystaceae cyanobacterium]